MAIAYVLISADPGKEYDIYNHLLKVPAVRDLMPLFGEYDLICKVEGPDFDSLGQTILGRIRSIAGVANTRTLTATKL